MNVHKNIEVSYPAVAIKSKKPVSQIITNISIRKLLRPDRPEGKGLAAADVYLDWFANRSLGERLVGGDIWNGRKWFDENGESSDIYWRFPEIAKNYLDVWRRSADIPEASAKERSESLHNVGDEQISPLYTLDRFLVDRNVLLSYIGARLRGFGERSSDNNLLPQGAFLCFSGRVQLLHGFGLRGGGGGIIARRGEQLLHVASLDASIPPQSVRSSPEVKSEERERERRECSDCALILIGEIGSTSKNETRSEIRLDDHHGDSSGVTFVKALILGGILVAMYTAFKRLGWLDKDDDEEETDHPKGPPRDPSP